MNIMEISNHLRRRLCALPGVGVEVESVDGKSYNIRAYVDIGHLRVQAEGKIDKIQLRHASCEKGLLDAVAQQFLNRLIHKYWSFQDEQG